MDEPLDNTMSPPLFPEFATFNKIALEINPLPLWKLISPEDTDSPAVEKARTPDATPAPDFNVKSPLVSDISLVVIFASPPTPDPELPSVTRTSPV